jgi:hypothetical protein
MTNDFIDKNLLVNKSGSNESTTNVMIIIFGLV